MNDWNISDEAAAILRDAVVCDMLVPASPGQPDMGRGYPEFLDRMFDHGINFASLTVQGDYPSIEDHFRWLARGRDYFIKRADKFVLVDKADDILRAKNEGKFAINFNFQGTNALFGEITMVEAYRKLGIGHMLFAYNLRNLMADGCHERTDSGLSRAGINLVKEMNRVGMIIDGSHTGYRSTMEIMEVTADPVIFSHSNPKALWQHDRNITDDQIRACAATGGVVGINGVGMFMSGNGRDVSAEVFVKHIDYIAQLAGPAHVGLGMDYVHDLEPLYALNEQFPENWPPEMGYGNPKDWTFMPPENVPGVVEELIKREYNETEIRGILGENWLRVMRQVWK